MVDFVKQGELPLFPDILWNRPITTKAAKQILAIGGYSGHLKRIQQAYQWLQAAGIGSIRLALPAATQPILGKQDHQLYLPSTNSGSLAKTAAPELLTFCQQVDGVWLVGDFSNHPDSSSLIESLLEQVKSPIVISQEVINLLPQTPKLVAKQPNRLLLADTQHLFKLAGLFSLGVTISRQASLLNKVELARSIAEHLKISVALLTKEVVVASKNQISITPIGNTEPLKIAAYAATYFLQHQDSFRSLTTAVHQATSQ